MTIEPSLHELSFVDTNTFVYAHSDDDPVKQQRAQALIAQLTRANTLAISTQVLNEFYRLAVHRTRGPRLSYGEALKAVLNIVAIASVVLVPFVVTSLAAMAATPQHSLDFWDALLWAAAKESGVSVIYTEDLPSAPIIGGIRYLNPLAAPPSGEESGTQGPL